MTRDELNALNRRVAVALGSARVELFGAEGWHWEQPGTELMFPLPDFAADPAAADLVRLEIERRGWELIQRSLIRPKLYDATIVHLDIPDGDKHHKTSNGADLNSPRVALCLAFLAAHDAQEGAGEPTEVE